MLVNPGDLLLTVGVVRVCLVVGREDLGLLVPLVLGGRAVVDLRLLLAVSDLHRARNVLRLETRTTRRLFFD